eukprot:3911412-Amphidinium_carterae.1
MAETSRASPLGSSESLSASTSSAFSVSKWRRKEKTSVNDHAPFATRDAHNNSLLRTVAQSASYQGEDLE